MANILIIGNITKDTYLALDPHSTRFELDDHDIPWLDLQLDGSSHHFFRQTTIYGGATVSLEVFDKFSLSALISGSSAHFSDHTLIVNDDFTPDHRYILTHDHHATYFSPTTRRSTRFVAPPTPIDWVFIDRSTTITPQLSSAIQEYLSLANHIKLAVFVHRIDPYLQPLLDRADLTFSDIDHSADYVITESTINTTDFSIPYSLGDKHFITTRLTAHSIIAATILAAHIKNESLKSQLLLAKYNVENSNLNGTLSLTSLKEQTMSQEWQIQPTEPKTTSSDLRSVAKKLLVSGKGILAADESGGSIHKKFEAMNIPDDEQHRRDYRNIFFTTQDLEKYASGVILFDETARQHADDGTDFVTFLSRRGVIPGIKVDQGKDEQPNGETITKGLDGLPARLTEYYGMGLRFAKWRAAFEITDTTPTDANIKQNCDILAQYAKDCQAVNIVPIVEPEVVYDGNYSLEQSAEVTTKILKQLIASLESHQVDLSGTILKTNMVLAGKQSDHQSTPEQVGKATAEVLRTSLPDSLAGVVFLSGGQSTTQATDNLQAVTNEGPFPWPVTFSFARALQDPALEAWKGDNANTDQAREAFLTSLIANSRALTKN